MQHSIWHLTGTGALAGKLESAPMQSEAKDNVWTPAQNSQLQHGGVREADWLHNNTPYRMDQASWCILSPIYSYMPYSKQAGYYFKIIVLIHVYIHMLTFFLSLMEPLPLTMILHPVSASSCLAVRPRGPRIRPTKLNCNTQTHTTLSHLFTHCMLTGFNVLNTKLQLLQ